MACGCIVDGIKIAIFCVGNTEKCMLRWRDV